MLRCSGQVYALIATALGALSVLPGCRGINSDAAARTGRQQPDTLMSAFAPPNPSVVAAWAVDPYDADKRYRGTLMLANASWGGEPVYIRLYEQALTDGVPNVRAAGVRGLALHGRPEHVPQIAPLLRADDRLLRWEAARALQRLHNPEAIPELLRAIEERNEEDPLVRAAAANALSQYAEARVVDGLIAALADRDLTVNRSAQDALRTLTGQDFGFNYRAWVAWKRDTPALFAGQTAYQYPVFSRGRRGLEWIIPFIEPPNEIPASPAGMAEPLALAPAQAAPPADSETP